MSTEKNKQLVRRYYEEIVNTGNVKNIREFVSLKYDEVYNNVRYSIGIEGAIDHIKGVRHTYPDLHLTIERQIAEGNWVVSQMTMQGTHQGEWMGIKPTGRKIEVCVVNMDKVINGRIVEHTGAANMLEPLLEIGAVVIRNNEDSSDEH